MIKNNYQSSLNQTNSFSKFANKSEFYLDSSLIAKQHSKQQFATTQSKFFTPEKNSSFAKSPMSQRDQTLSQYKQLTKNYYQKKYILLTTGNEQNINQWKKHLIDGLIQKVKAFCSVKVVMLQKKRVHLKGITMSNSTDRFPFLANDISVIDQIVKQRVPGIDLILEQDRLINKNARFLKENQNVDYDTKLQTMIQQYEIIIDRIQKEAFKIQLPKGIDPAMENYNDFYDSSTHRSQFYNSAIFGQGQQLEFEKKPLVKNTNQSSFYQRHRNLLTQEASLSPQVQKKSITTVNSPQLTERDYPIQQDSSDESQPEIESQNSIIEQQIQQLKNKLPFRKSHCRRKYVKKPAQVKTNHTFVDYMLGLGDVYECQLEQFKDLIMISKYESLEFIDISEEQLLNDQKKNPHLKPLIQGMIEEIKKNKQQQQFPIQELIKILVRLPENKTNQTSGIALNIISKLFNLRIIQEADFHPLLHSLYLFKDEQIENVQLKLVQCSVHLIHTEIVTINNPECVEKLICIFFTLANSKNPIIQTTSMTGLMEIIDLLYYQYKDKPHRNGVLIFLQLIQGLKGQKVPFVVQHQYAKGICRDMIFQVIQNLGTFINTDDQINKLVGEISGVIYEEMGLDSADVQFNARRIRDSFRMIICLRRDASLLKHISLLFTRSPSYGYIRFWIIEGIHSLLQDSKLVMLLHQSSEEQQHQSTFLQHLIYIVKFSTEQEPQYNISQSTHQNYTKQAKLYDQNIINMLEAPVYSKNQFTQKSIECIVHFTDSILQIYYEKGVVLFNQNYQLIQSKVVVNDNCKEINQIMESTQQLTLKAIQNLMVNLNDERLFQNLLNSIQTWINLTGALGQTKTRDSYIKFLSSLCASKQSLQLTMNQLQSAKTLFNIAQLGNLLDVKSWYIIMKTMQQFDSQLQKSLSSSAVQQESHPELYQQEISLLYNVLEGLFHSSNQYEDANLLYMIEAINQVTLGLMEQFNNSVQSQIDPKSIQFGLQKIHQIAKQNWFRINKFWEFITAHFLCIANYKHKIFRESSLEVFSQLIQQGFQYFLKPDQLSCWSGDSWQEHLLKPIQQMIVIPYADVKETLLNILFKLIQNNGHEINKLGFQTIIEILLISCDETEPTGYVNVGFHILELLIGQFLHLLDLETTRKLLPLIQQFRQRTTEQNISFVSVGLIWQLADNLSKVCQNQTLQLEIEDLWTAVLMSLKDLSLDFASDVRQSALHIIIQIILINFGSFKVTFQMNLLHNLIFKILDDLIGRVAQLQQLQIIFHLKFPKYISEDKVPKFTKFQENEIQNSKSQPDFIAAWEETLKLMIQNLTKVMKKIGGQEDEEFRSQAHELYNQTFLRLIIAFKINNLDIKWEIIKLIRENTEIIIEKNFMDSFDWSKEFITSIQEFIGQKLQDNRDVKTLINKILPEVCELYVLILKAYSKDKNTFYQEIIQEVFDSYQAVVDLPINIENITNIKIWMDEKQLHDFAEDFYIHLNTQENKTRFYDFLLTNMSKEGGMTKLQDLVVLKYIQLFNKYSQDEGFHYQESIEQYVKICSVQLSTRSNPQKVNSIKSYNKNNKPLWVLVLPLLIENIEFQKNKEQFVKVLAAQLENTLQWDKVTSIEGLKSCIDVELSICEWLLKQDGHEEQVINYWFLLSRNINLYQLEDLFYETRQRLMHIIFQNPSNLKPLYQISNFLVEAFMKDEYMSGSMPLSRKRVQEIISLLLELQQLKDMKLEPHPLLQVFECLVELITTREIDIKQPLQNLFKEVALKIRQHK